jgi:hypothetical protein
MIIHSVATDEDGRSTLNRHINNILCHLNRAILALGRPDYNYSTSELSASSLQRPSRKDSNLDVHGIIKEAQKPRYTWGQDNRPIGVAQWDVTFCACCNKLRW